MMTRTLIQTLLLLAVAITAAFAQPSDTIIANPAAVKLHKIWMVRGSVLGGDEVGAGAGGLGDIFGTGYGAWAVNFGKARQWRVYAGGPDTLSTTPVWTLDSSDALPLHPVVGNFLGTTKKFVAFPKYRFDSLGFRLEMPLFAVEGTSFAKTPTFVLTPWNMTPATKLGLDDMVAVDLDRDGADELVLISHGVRRADQWSPYGEIWIYRGGENFQVDTPSVIIRDDEPNDGVDYHAYLGTFNNDAYPDLLLSSWRSNRTIALKFFWGKPDSPWFASVADRIVSLENNPSNLDTKLTPLDVDGDGRSDLLQGRYYYNTVSLFRSRARGTLDGRSLSADSADEAWYAPGLYDHANAGYLNDSTHRYQMPALFPQSPFNSSSTAMVVFSSSANGSDASYEAYYDGVLDTLIEGSVFGRGGPITDVNGDGWDDYLAAQPQWYHDGEAPGIALILAGGPYIPRDFISSVQEVAIAGREAGLHVWPNPVEDDLSIAWRGDLKQMPTRFEIHDLLGNRVASGTVVPQLGAARWHCAGLAAGTYLLTAFDHDGAVIATTTIIKQ